MMTRTYRTARNNGGFTLIELILVTVIISILAGMVVLQFRGTATDAKVRAALGDISSYETAIENYALNNNDRYPKQLSDLLTGKNSMMRELRPDPWGNAYVYLNPGSHFTDSYDVFSMGPDGARDTEDDVKPWVRPEEEE